MRTKHAQYVGTAEAAAVLGVIVRRVQQLIEDEKLPAVKMGRDWQILWADLQRFKAQDRPPGWKKGRKRTS